MTTRVKTACNGPMSHRTYLGHIGDTQNEAYRVKNVGFARPIETCDGVERRVPSRNLRPNRIRLEA
jgi:hypothetical protein